MLNHLLAVMVGGGIGAGLRYAVVNWCASKNWCQSFPYSTLIVNVTGSLLIGICAYYFISKPSDETIRVFLMIGLLGSFTTVSTFSLETVELLSNELYSKALVNSFATFVLCISATCIGLLIGKILINFLHNSG